MESNTAIFTDDTYENNGFVTRQNAEFRGSIVSDCSYDITVALPRGDFFWGHAIIKFALSSVPAKFFFLDFRGIKISNLIINDYPVDQSEEVFKDHHV